MNKKTLGVVIGLVAVVILFLILRGCSDNDTPTRTTSGDPTAGLNENPPATSGGQNPSSPSDPDAPTPTPPVREPVIRDIDVAQPGTGGYTSAPANEAAELGGKMDEAIKNMNDAFAQINFFFEERGNLLEAGLDAKVRDSKTYRIEYCLPRTGPDRNRLIGDGKQEVVYEKLNVVPAKAKTSPQPWTAAEIDQWTTEFPRLMWMPFSEGYSVWKPFLSGLKDPAHGFDTVVEKTETVITDPVDPSKPGTNRPIYRVIARGQDDNATEIEMVIDGIRYMPLTVKVTKRKGTDAQYQMYWSARWAFGGAHEDKDFVIPRKTQSL